MKNIVKIIIYYLILSTVTVKSLTGIKVDNFNLVPYFNKDITKYNVFVNSEIESVNVTAIKDEEDDYVTGTGNINIMDGKNEVILKVVKKNGEIDSYEINIFKNYVENKDENNATLDKLEITGYDINFEPNKLTYEINIDNEESLNINYTRTTELSSVIVSGNSNFKIGENIIKISVTSKNKNNTNNYIIKVNKVVSVFEETSEIENENILGKETLTKKETNVISVSLISTCSIIIGFMFYIMFIFKRH